MSIKNLKPDKRYNGGIYYPANIDKYIGDGPIICRSSWEKKYCMYCDNNDLILKWSSEPFKIKFYNILTKKEHTYYPDFYIKIKKDDGSIKEYIIEIKPAIQLVKPTPPKRNSVKALSNYKYLYEIVIKNYCKAKAAKEYASERNMEYIILTENSIK